MNQLSDESPSTPLTTAKDMITDLALNLNIVQAKRIGVMLIRLGARY